MSILKIQKITQQLHAEIEQTPKTLEIIQQKDPR